MQMEVDVQNEPCISQGNKNTVAMECEEINRVPGDDHHSHTNPSGDSSCTTFQSQDHNVENDSVLKNILVFGNKSPSTENSPSSYQKNIKNVAKKSTTKSAVVALQNTRSNLFNSKVIINTSSALSSLGNKRSNCDDPDDHVVGKVARTSNSDSILSSTVNDSTICSHCDMNFPSKDDLIKHLFDQLPASQHEFVNEGNFETSSVLLEQLEYADVENDEIRGHESSNNQKKHKISKLPILPGRLSVYYCQHCNNCMHRVHEIHLHRHCKSSIITEVCLLCGLSFSNKSLPFHYKCHENYPITLKQIDIYTTDHKKIESIPMPNYYRCEVCKINHESKIKFNQHICDEDYEKCEFCGELFSKSLYLAHKIFHSVYDKGAVKSDSSFVFKREKKYKRTSLATSNTNVFKTYNTKRKNKILLYKCLECSVTITKHSISLKHECIPDSEKRTCDICNVVYAYYQKNAHKQLHKDNPNLTEDKLCFELFKPQQTMSQSELINEGRNRHSKTIVYKCLDCDVIVMSDTTSKNHKCIPLRDIRFCNLCKQKHPYNQTSFHQRLHDINPNFNIENIEIVYFNSNNKLSDRASVVPGKFEMILNFQCMNCKVITDSYDKVVEHSQYYYKISNKKFESTLCSQCNLLIDNDYLVEHKKQHSTTQSSEKFKIVMYEPEKLMHESWFELFSDIPEEKMRHIFNESVYNEVRHISLDLKKHGKPSFNLYTCAKCETAVSKDNISRHLSNKCTKGENVCIECDILFNRDSCWREHKKLHDSGVNETDFRVLRFEKKASTPKKRKFKVYKCSNCHVSIINQNNVDLHVCVPKKHRRLCDECNQILGYKSMGKHHGIHKKYSDFKECNIEVEYFNLKEKETQVSEVANEANNVKNIDNSNEDKKLRLTVYKCKDCSLIIFSEGNIKNHRCVADRFKRFCDICEQYYACQRTTAHDFKHQQNPDFIPGRYNVIPFESRHKLENINRDDDTHASCNLTVYKCLDCSLIVFSEHSQLSHRCVEDKFKKYCSICQQYFACQQKTAHEMKHQKCPDLTPGRYKIIPFKSRAKLPINRNKINTISMKNTKIFTIYKCVCGLHFPSEMTFKEHTESSRIKTAGLQRLPKIHAQECSKCGLLFPSLYLESHLNQHVSNTEIIIKEVDSNTFCAHATGPKQVTSSQQQMQPKTDHKEFSVSEHLSDSTSQSKINDSCLADSSSETIEDDDSQILLFKCVECNVYFLTQIKCALHTKTHSKLDPIDYIECKICSLQFPVESLSKHIKKHHKSGKKFKTAIVEEHTPLENSAPKTRLTTMKFK